MHAMDRLQSAIVAKQNPTVLGLDTQFAHLPQPTQDAVIAQIGPLLPADPAEDIDYRDKAQCLAAAAIRDYNFALIDALADLVPAVKVQIAYYELLGAPGIAVFEECLRYAKQAGLVAMADAKRNDIGSTAQAYADAFLGKTTLGSVRFSAFDADMLTVNPYLGTDGIAPFVEACKAYDKGIFALVKTSNPSSGELQDLPAQDGRPFYAQVADKLRDWGQGLLGEAGYSCVGAVAGATYPEELARLRGMLPNAFFLVPGYGAQGGTADNLAPAFDPRGYGAVVNASRSILAAHQKSPGLSPVDAARQEAAHMKASLLAALGGKISG